jgi:hypothetical protein
MGTVLKLIIWQLWVLGVSRIDGAQLASINNQLAIIFAS